VRPTDAFFRKFRTHLTSEFISASQLSELMYKKAYTNNAEVD
jgi:hypothetical protein